MWELALVVCGASNDKTCRPLSLAARRISTGYQESRPPEGVQGRPHGHCRALTGPMGRRVRGAEEFFKVVVQVGQVPVEAGFWNTIEWFDYLEQVAGGSSSSREGSYEGI